jgi:HPt (histidine-containing phosphotransfer) domain-containing protein
MNALFRQKGVDMTGASEVIDATVFTELRESTGAEFVVELVDAFLDEAPQLLAQMRQALADGDAATFRRAAHSLKSNGQTFGAAEFAGLARELEQGGAAGQNATSLDRLEALFAGTAAALKELCHER